MTTLTPVNFGQQFKDKLDIAQALGGAAHWYGLRMRPYSIGAQPTDVSCFLEPELAQHVFEKLQDDVNVRHGALAYPYPLDDDQVARYEMVSLDVGSKAEYKAPVGDMTTESLSLEMADIIFKELYDTHKITFDLFDTWCDYMDGKDITVLKSYARYHPAFINRHNDKAQYAKFVEVFDLIDVESIVDAIADNYLA